MSNIKFFSFLSYAAILLAMGCSSGEESITKPDEIDRPVSKPKQILLTCDIQQPTRVTDTGYESGDKIGLYVVNYSKNQPGELQDSGNHVDNMAFTYSGSWNPQTPIYWLDDTTPADFYVYHPYTHVQTVTEHTFQVNSDQATADRYKASDFLYGKTLKVSPTNAAVSIQTKHLMSNMIIKVAPGNGFTAESLAKANVSVKLNGHLHTALINLKNGTLTATGEAGSTLPYQEGEIYKALVVPQTVTADNFISVTVDNREFKLKKSFTFISGKRHVFTVTVSKTSNGINVGVTPWEDDGVDHGGTAE